MPTVQAMGWRKRVTDKSAYHPKTGGLQGCNQSGTLWRHVLRA